MTTKSVTSDHKLATSRKEVSPFGKELKKAREKLKWTRKHLNEETMPEVGSKGVHENTVYNIEKGNTAGNLETQRVLTKIIDAEHKTRFGHLYPWDGETEIITKKSLVEFINRFEVEIKLHTKLLTPAN